MKPTVFHTTLGSLTLLEGRLLRECPVEFTQICPIVNKDVRLSTTSPFLLRGLEFRFRNYAECIFESCCFECFDKTLTEELAERKFRDYQFSESQIIDILSNVIEGLIALKELGTSHGGIHPEAVFKVGNVYKIADQSLYLGSPDWFLWQVNDDKAAFLSPERLRKLLEAEDINNKFVSKLPSEKDDVFGLGMTIFCCLTQENPRHLINGNTATHDLGKIREALFGTLMNKSYSRDLIELIELMLIEKDDNRLSLASVKSRVDKFRGYNEEIYRSAYAFLNDSQFNSSSLRAESAKKAMVPLMNLQPPVTVTVTAPKEHYQSDKNFNGFMSVQKSPDPKLYSTEVLSISEFKTPEKTQICDKIHRVTPGSLGKSAIKIVYTPSKKTEERNKQLDEEYSKTLERLEIQKKSTEHSIDFLKGTIEFLKGSQSQS